MSDLPFDHVVVPGHRAADLRRERLDARSVIPLILGAPDELEDLVSNLAFAREAPSAIVARADRVDAAAWYEHRYADDPDRFAIDEGEWPEPATPCHDLLGVRDPDSGDFLPEVVIGMIPATAPWEIPAVLGFGGWDTCPQAHEHVALFRRWHERFGASIAVVVGGMIELEVARPPLDRDAAELLAMEHFLYCPGAVRGDEQTLAEIASSLMFGTVWSFRW